MPQVTQMLSRALRDHAPLAPGIEAHLAAAVRQSTTASGKLLRAHLAFASALASGAGESQAVRLACAVEYFHSASLLLDDLPCMDDASTRRGVACVHRVHGEATAILAALALINRAYGLVNEATVSLPPAVRAAVDRGVQTCLGCLGVVGGQARDLRFCETDGGASQIGRIAVAKTGALFRLALEVPALLGGPGGALRADLRRLCLYWGLGYQAVDDLGDLHPGPCAGKTAGRDQARRRPNLALALGEAETLRRIARLQRLSAVIVERLVHSGAQWRFLMQFQAVLFPEQTLPALELLEAAA